MMKNLPDVHVEEGNIWEIVYMDNLSPTCPSVNSEHKVKMI